MGQFFMNVLPKNKFIITLFGEEDWKNPEQKINNQDIIFLSIPINITITIIKKISPFLKKNTLLVDISSIKEKIMQTMLFYHKGPVLGLHPMFGPDIKNIKNKIIISCHGRYYKDYKYFINILKNISFDIKEMTPIQHDKFMHIIQGIEHFNVFCLGIFLKKHNINLLELRSLASPIYKIELDILGRLFYQKSSLYADIITSNKQRINIIQEYTKIMYKQSRFLNKKNSKKMFIKNFEQIKKWMNDITNTSYTNTNHLIESMNY